MLIEFSVANFRSFRERQTFSMVAAPRLRARGQLIQPSKSERFPDLLKVAVIYGPNASGKSNLLRAMEVPSMMARRVPTAIQEPLPAEPFRFDKKLSDRPSEFEVNFFADGVRYQFNLAINSERVLFERLISYPKGVENLLYSRSFDGGYETYEFGAIDVDPALRDVWRKLTSPRVLFIAQAVANSNEETIVFRAPFKYLSGNMSTTSSWNLRDMLHAVHVLAAEHESFAQDVAQLLSELDVPVSRIDVRKSTSSRDEELKQFAKFYGEGDVERFKKFFDDYEMTLTHKSALGEAKFDLSEESDGTQNLLGFALPWLYNTQRRSSGGPLVVDELENSLHPVIVQALIGRYLALKTNNQLIFTSHNTHLMDSKLLRRDQFWLTERDMNGATNIRSVYSFVGREGEDIEKKYFEGKYRSLPFIRA